MSKWIPGSNLRRSALTAALVLFSITSVRADHAWSTYHWERSSNPLVLQVGDNVSAAWDPYLDEAIADWNQSGVLSLTEVAGGTRPKNCRPTLGRVEACSEAYGNTGWLGIAQIYLSGGHIVQGTTRLNDTYFNTATYNTPAWRRLVTCQEIGHDFGLDHQDEVFNNANLGTCMDYTNDPDGPLSNEHPNQHDYEQLDIIYGHLDAAAAPAQLPPAFSQIGLDGPAQWGVKVRSTNAGRTELYMLDFGHGNRVFTHVIWALESGRQAQ